MPSRQYQGYPMSHVLKKTNQAYSSGPTLVSVCDILSPKFEYYLNKYTIWGVQNDRILSPGRKKKLAYLLPLSIWIQITIHPLSTDGAIVV